MSNKYKMFHPIGFFNNFTKKINCVKQKCSVAATDSKCSEPGDFINLAKEIRSNPPSLNPPLFCVCEVELNVLDLFNTGGYRITTVLMFINILPPKKRK